MSEEKDKEEEKEISTFTEGGKTYYGRPLSTGEKIVEAFQEILRFLAVMIIAPIVFVVLSVYHLLPAAILFQMTGIDNNSLGALIIVPCAPSIYVMWRYAGGEKMCKFLGDLFIRYT